MLPTSSRDSPRSRRSGILAGRKRKRTLEARIGAVSEVPGLQASIKVPASLWDNRESEAEYLLSLRQLSSEVVAHFRANGAVNSPNGEIKPHAISVQKLRIALKENSDRETHLVAILNGFLFICCCLGYLVKNQETPDTYFIGLHRQDVFWGQTLENFVHFVGDELNSIRMLPTSETNLENVEIYLVPFVESESEEIYFSSLSRLLRTGGHKLKSKLKPENIGLLVPGFFLPSHPRILKPQVALQVAEKSNHLYTWKDAGDAVCVRRKKASWHSLLSRNIRPRNRCNFESEEVFYSAWDTTFYTLKCEEVLENEYYNQLENSLNNHGKRKQLSMKKIEINKKKKANDTKDSFYYDSFLGRPLALDEATNIVDNLRHKAVELYKVKYFGKNAIASSNIKTNAAEHTPAQQSTTEIPESNGNTNPKNTAGNKKGTLPSNVSIKKQNEDEDRKPVIKKEERFGGCAKVPLDEHKITNSSAYSNNILGVLRRPRQVLRTHADLLNFVHSKPVNVKKVKHQFFEPSDRPLRKPVTRNGTAAPLVSIPQIQEVRFSLEREDKAYHAAKVSDSVFGDEQCGSKLKDTERTKIITQVLARVVFKLIDGTFQAGDQSSSDENTDDEIYEAVHQEYLNIPALVGSPVTVEEQSDCGVEPSTKNLKKRNGRLPRQSSR